MKHYTMKEEIYRDYPDMVLVINNNYKEHELEVKPYNLKEPVDIP
jgi:hypothetical protein